MSQFHPLIEDLLKLETPKTWSLIATIFGDLDGDSLSGKQIGALLSHAGIKPAASRVALHRLRNEGWIVSKKHGREVSYTLSDHARAETVTAQKDVYRRDVKFASGWNVLALQTDATIPQEETIALGKNLILAPNGAKLAGALPLAFMDDAFPAWFVTRLAAKHVLAQAAALTDLVERFGGPETPMTATDTTTARLLIIHYWRKMALRTRTWAHIGLLPEGELARCHRSVTRLLSQTSKLTPPDV